MGFTGPPKDSTASVVRYAADHCKLESRQEAFLIANAEEEELQQDAAALAGEFREVRRLRRLLAAARQEAQQALADVRTAEAASGAGPACSGCHKLQQELSSLQVAHTDPLSSQHFILRKDHPRCQTVWLFRQYAAK